MNTPTRLFLPLLAGLHLLATAACGQGLVARYLPEYNTRFSRPEPDHDAWSRCPPATAPLLPQNLTTPSKFVPATPTMEARAMHNGEWIAFRLEWTDATTNALVTRDEATDAVAMAMPVAAKGTTAPFMGGPGTPMEILHWKAVWQRDVEQGYADITDTHPNTVVVRYHGSTTSVSHPLPVVLASDEARLANPAINYGNPVSQVDRTVPAEQLAAIGFTGTLTTQKKQDVRAQGRHADGRWAVVFARPLRTGDAQDKELSPGLEHELNFAVWDGAAGDVGARKSYSMFIPLLIEAIP